MADAATFRARSGSALYVEDAGGDGAPILALPGLGGGAWFFSGLAQRLAPAYRVVSCDLPGVGRSAAGAHAWSLESWVSDIGDLLRHRIGQPAVIVGHSLGTILALQGWQAWPELVRGFVFVGGLPEPRPIVRQRLTERAAAVAATGLGGWGRRASAANFAETTRTGQPELVALFERLFEAQDAPTYVRCCKILIAASAASVVPTVTVPSLSITGADDQYAPPDLVQDFMGRLVGPSQQEVLAGCGHLPFLEAPEPFASLLQAFLARVC